MTRVIADLPPDLPLDAKSQYLFAVSGKGRLSDVEERALIERIERGKAEQVKLVPDASVVQDGLLARDDLIEGLQGLVRFLAGKWHGRFCHQDWMDLVQEGNVALLRMIERYDLCQVDNIGALAAGCIRHAFCSLLLQREHVLRFPEHLVRDAWKLRRVSQSLLHRLGQEPSVGELACEMQVSEPHVHEVMQLQEHMQVASLPLLSVGQESASEEPASIFLLYAAESSDGARQREAAIMLQHGLHGVLTQWQLEVVLRYHGLEDYAPQTFDQIASAFAVTQTAVRIAYRSALRKLKRFLAGAYGELSGQVLEGYYTAAQAATVLGMPEPTFWKYARREQIACVPVVPGSRVRVYAQSDIDALAAERAQVAAAYYTSGQAQERLGVTETTLRRWVGQGVIERSRFERVPGCFYARAEIDALVSSRRVACAESGVA